MFQPILPYNQMEHEIEHSMPQITQNVDRKIGLVFLALRQAEPKIPKTISQSLPRLKN